MHTAALIPENRARLHENIALRFHLMLEQGFIGEVENLRRLYPSLTADSPAIRCVGYRQAWEYLDGKPISRHLSRKALPPRANLPNAN